jgi:hypothetical protein
MGNLMSPNPTLFNRANNVVNPNIYVAQSNALLDPLLKDCWRREKLTSLFFRLP